MFVFDHEEWEKTSESLKPLFLQLKRIEFIAHASSAVQENTIVTGESSSSNPCWPTETLGPKPTNEELNEIILDITSSNIHMFSYSSAEFKNLPHDQQLKYISEKRIQFIVTHLKHIYHPTQFQSPVKWPTNLLRDEPQTFLYKNDTIIVANSLLDMQKSTSTVSTHQSMKKDDALPSIVTQDIHHDTKSTDNFCNTNVENTSPTTLMED